MTYAVVGLGQSGRAAAGVLRQLGHDVIGFDSADQARQRAADELHIDVTDDVEALVMRADKVVVSPGVAPHTPVFAAAVAAKKEIIGEVELAWRLQHQVYHHDTPWLTVTGTNGKTTTVGMAHAMAEAAGLRSIAVGNIGVPVIDAVARDDIDVMVVELSSFQLHTVTTVEPTASICINIAADHLDWHGTLGDYIADKAKVYQRTRVARVYNEAAPLTKRLVDQYDDGVRSVGITTDIPAAGQLGIVEDILVDRAYGPDPLHHADELATFADFDHLGGVTPALVTDALAASALVRAIDVRPGFAAQGLRNFHVDKHRRAVISTKAQLTWIDDSKATNAHAAQGSLQGMPERSVIWIVGGDAKGQDFHSLIKAVLPSLRAAIVIGSDQEPLRQAFEEVAPDLPRAHIKDVREGETLKTLMVDVVNQAVAMSVPGNTVILAPACASWDQFDNYQQRGALFASVVDSLE